MGTKAALVLLALAAAIAFEVGCASSDKTDNPLDLKDAPIKDAKTGKQPTPPTPDPAPAPAPAPPPPPDAGGTPVDPKKACADMAAAVGDTGQRECGFPSASGAQEFVDQFANGNCANVKSVRDGAALYAKCIPFLKAQNCTDWTAGKSDPSCDNQLQM